MSLQGFRRNLRTYTSALAEIGNMHLRVKRCSKSMIYEKQYYTFKQIEVLQTITLENK